MSYKIDLGDGEEGLKRLLAASNFIKMLVDDDNTKTEMTTTEIDKKYQTLFDLLCDVFSRLELKDLQTMQSFFKLIMSLIGKKDITQKDFLGLVFGFLGSMSNNDKTPINLIENINQ